MTEQQWANRRHSAIVFSVDDEYEKTPSGRIYPKDVVERHHHHHNKAPKLSRQPSPSGRQSPDRRTATRHVSNVSTYTCIVHHDCCSGWIGGNLDCMKLG